MSQRRARAALATLPRLGASLAAAALLAACDLVEPSENVNQDRIWTEYELHYDADADVSAARATFRFGGASGTLLELSDGSHVSANGQTLSRRTQPLTGITFYERAFAGRTPSATFEFVDLEGARYRNSVLLRDIAAPAAIGPIDNDASYEVRWVGPPLAPNEEVGAVLYRVVGGASLALFTQRDAGATSIILDRGQLEHLAAGDATLVLERRNVGVLAEATDVGGRIQARYTAEPVRVEIRD
jgi:hypothetical protein